MFGFLKALSIGCAKMMKPRSAMAFPLFLIALCLLLAQCGNTPTGNNNPTRPPDNHSGPTDPGTPTPEGNHVRLYLFSAPSCQNCNKELPDVKARFLKLTADQQKRIEVTVNVTTGPAMTDPASQPVADEYGKKMGLPFKMLADKNWKTYHKFYEEGTLLPATVIVDTNSNVIKIYDPGMLEGSDMDEMFRTLLANLK